MRNATIEGDKVTIGSLPQARTETVSAVKTVASYCTTFLKPEMLHVYRQVTSLRGYRTFIMTRALQDSERFPFADLELIAQPQMNLLRHGWLKFVERQPPIVYRGEYQMLSSLLERRKADLMHIYFGHTGVHLLPFIEAWHRPCVVSFHGADVAVKQDVPNYVHRLRHLFSAVPLVFARSESLARRLEQFGCPPEKLRLNRTGVPLRQFLFMERRAPSDGAWKIVQACRLIPKKGLATAIKAFARFAQAFPKAEFCIAGKGPLQNELTQLAAELGVGEKVHFAGFLDQEDLCELYHRSHFFLHPSELQADQDQEGIPNSMLEAMATGLPVVATRHGGIPEAIQHGSTGYLVAERSPDELAGAMVRLATSSDLLATMGFAASKSVAENFEQSAQIARLESFYDEALSLRRPVPVSARLPVETFTPPLEQQVALK